jgi:hypothetical protein
MEIVEWIQGSYMVLMVYDIPTDSAIFIEDHLSPVVECGTFS